MTPKERRELIARIRSAYYRAESFCRWAGSRELSRAVEIASKQERQHRRFGRRLVGNIGARASVEVCAQLFALRGFLAPKRERCLTDREDFVRAYAAAAELDRALARRSEGSGEHAEGARKTAAELRAFKRAARWVREVDYCDLIGSY